MATITSNPPQITTDQLPASAARFARPGQPLTALSGSVFAANSAIRGVSARSAAALVPKMFDDGFDAAAEAQRLIDMKGKAAALDQAVAKLTDSELEQVIQQSLGETRHIINPRARDRKPIEYRADTLLALQDTALTTGSQPTKARLLQGINQAIQTLDRNADITLSGNARLQPSSIPPSKDEIAAKRAQIAQQRAILEALRAKGSPESTKLAGQLEKHYHAQELSLLATDVYHWADDGPHANPPVGWSRGSEDPKLLAKAGIELEQLRPAMSGFRAELYFPDPAVHGPNQKPVLVFKGTTADSAEDWANNFTQGLGKRSDYYDKAMDLAEIIRRRFGDKFELSGHSLGGGMASAASAVTGVPAATFNAAGLHDNTARAFMERNKLGTPFPVTDSIRAYRVEGEVLTTFQNSASEIDPERAEQLSDLLRTAATVAELPIVNGVVEHKLGAGADFGAFKFAQGEDLLAMPPAAGDVVVLDALNATGHPAAQAAAEFAGPKGIATRLDQILDRYESEVDQNEAQWFLKEFVNNGRAAREAGQEIKKSVFPGLSDALSESVARHGMDYVAGSIHGAS